MDAARAVRRIVATGAIDGEWRVSEYVVRPLEPDTWDGFAAMVELHNGVFGGCWCTWFHTMSADKERTYEANQSLKRRLVEEGRAHASLVYHGDRAVAWCEYGSPDELPNIYHRKQYEEELDVLPDFRITCIFVDKSFRRRGLSALALQGALDLMVAAGGGVVEGYPHDTDGKKKSVLYNGTRTLFEDAGFEFVRSKGTGNCVMRRTLP
ncbi:GNAT family N-acetyltransferase [Nocardioides sp.]|uniref:GNAT family N-acetyltransferase n=1 Tax=Nocardioides sp. TaxID=35761 RepID=UPI00286DA3DF|nr:GNAT family N-acetyltransferase [Nocardioides sp.]